MTGTHRHLIRIIAAVLVWTTVPQAAFGWSLFGPKTYNECVLEKIKDANNTAAVIAVKQSCRELFPLKKVVLPSSAVKNITVSDAEFIGQSFKMTLHNNHDWTVTNFLIIFSETGGKAGTVIPASTTPPEGTVGTGFEMEEVITSYGKSTIYLNLDPNKAYKWWLSGVKGYQ
jgi:hypothetical protein